jgi:Kef-type K+ transport system membrane component KefB
VDLKHVIAFVLLDVAIVVVAARLMGRLFRRLGQPAVIGEIVAGIALGPTLLGALPGDLDGLLFPDDVRPFLTVIAQLGLALFMFIVGLEVDLSLIKGRQKAAGAIATGSLLLPFAFGAATAVVLHPLHAQVDGQPVSALAFVLFVGVAMSITALPVLARILTERGMQRTPTGVLALACAAIDDVLGWALLAVVVAVVAGGTLAGVGTIMGLTLAFVLVMFLVVRPLLTRLVPWHRAAGRLTPDILAIVLAGLFLSAWATDVIGVHAIFGAFVFGAVMPRKEAAALTREILERLEQVSLLLLLPVFFVVAGLQVDIGAVGASGLWQLGLILLAAIGGKFIGAAVAARAQRMPRRQATAIGLLMNTRGLTEIVILQVGVQLGVLDPTMFTLMVIMALVTTAMTGPLLRLAYPDRVLQRELAAAERAELGEVDAFTALVSVPEVGAPGASDGDGERLVELARGLLGREQPARVVLARLLPQPTVALELASGLGTDLARITAAGDELRVLARRLEAEGVACSVVARFSADPATDLAALATAVAADIVLVPEGSGTAQGTDAEADGAGLAGAPEAAAGVATLAPPVAALPQVTEAALAVVRFPAPGTAPPPAPVQVAVLTDGGAGARAALRLGAHLALHHATSLAVGGTEDRRSGRRVGAALQALHRHEVPAHDLPDGVVFHVLLLPEGAPEPRVGSATTVVWVRPGAADVDEDLDQAVGRIVAG